MIKGELTKENKGFRIKIAELETAIDKKKESISLKPTPIDICREYFCVEEALKTSVNKKRKEFAIFWNKKSENFVQIHNVCDLISFNILIALI